MNNFINTAATDIARARTVGLNQLTPEPFPVIVVGTQPSMSWFFANRGVIESWSGAGDLTLRVTVADVSLLPVDGTWSIACGTTATLPWYTNPAGLQNALNNLSTVNSDGGVLVESLPTAIPGTYAQCDGSVGFLIAHKSTGVKTGFTVSPALLVPDCTARLSVLTNGNASTRQLTSLALTRTTMAQLENWSTVSTPYAGWSGTLALDTSAALQFIALQGQRMPNGGPGRQAQTLLTVETIDASGNRTARYQTPIILRALNYGATVAATSMQKDYFVKPNITALASNVSSNTALGGLTTSDGTYPAYGTVQTTFANDVVALFIRKASTANQSVPFVVRPYDYDATNNAYQWILDRVTKGAQPCVWNTNTNAFHYEAAIGNTNAVSYAIDQTGFSLPA